MDGRLIVDRFEGEIVYLQDEEKRLHKVARGDLPAETKEGDCLVMEEGRLNVNAFDTQQRLQRMEQLLKRLTEKK